MYSKCALIVLMTSTLALSERGFHVPTSVMPLEASENVLKVGEDMIHHSFREARPIWFLSSLYSLRNVWASQATSWVEKERLLSMRVKSGGKFTEEYLRELRLRYGFFPAHYDNGGLPLGLTKTDKNARDGIVLYPGALRPPIIPVNGEAGLNLNCMLCHSRAVPTKDGFEISEGVSNPWVDFQRFHEDMAAAAGTKPGIALERNPDRNSYVNAGIGLGVIAKTARTEDGRFRANKLAQTMASSKEPDPKIQEALDNAPLMKTPAWTGLSAKHAAGFVSGPEDIARAEAQIQEAIKTGENIFKKGYYADGSWVGDFSHVLAGIMISLKPNGSDYRSYRARFNKYAWPYLEQLKSPEYPWKDELDSIRVAKGHEIFENNCASCHGSYKREDNRYIRDGLYPGELIPLSVIGTDDKRALYTDAEKASLTREGRSHHKMMGRAERGDTGYIAPPLDGVWARGAFLHNGSVPNLWQVLDSSSRYDVWGQDLGKHDPLDPKSYDRERGGWYVEDLTNADIKKEIRERPYLRVYDPRPERLKNSGLQNSGHEFGDDLTDEERRNLIQFLYQL